MLGSAPRKQPGRRTMRPMPFSKAVRALESPRNDMLGRLSSWLFHANRFQARDAIRMPIEAISEMVLERSSCTGRIWGDDEVISFAPVVHAKTSPRVDLSIGRIACEPIEQL